jgi:hypothetical protein
MFANVLFSIFVLLVASSQKINFETLANGSANFALGLFVIGTVMLGLGVQWSKKR